MILNNSRVEIPSYQKHPDIILYGKLNFKQHAEKSFSKINKGISVIKNIRH